MKSKWIIFIAVIGILSFFPLVKGIGTMYNLMFNMGPYIVRDLPSDITTGSFMIEEDTYSITLTIRKNPEDIVCGKAVINSQPMNFYLKVDRNIEYAEIYDSAEDKLIGICNYSVNDMWFVLSKYDSIVYGNDDLPITYDDRFFSCFESDELVLTKQ